MPNYVTQSIYVENKTNIKLPPAVFSIGADGVFTNDPVRPTSSIQYNEEGFLVIKNNVLETIAEMFGVDSNTYKGIKVMKQQARNFFNLTNGRLVLMSTAGTNATNASYTTIAITDTIINALKQVDNGYIGINVDGSLIKLTKLDFTKISNIADIKKVFDKQTALKCDISIVDDDKLKFTSKTLGDEGGITFSSLQDITGTDLSTATYFDIANGTITAGADAVEEMSVSEAIDYYRTKVVFCCFTTIQDIDVAEVKKINDKLTEIEEEQHKVFFYNAPTKKAVDDINTNIFDANGGALKCMHLFVSGSNVNSDEAIKARCATLSYATGTDTYSRIDGRKVSMQGKTLNGVDLSSSKFDNQLVNYFLDKGVATYQYILEQNTAMFRCSNNNWAPEDLVNYANIVNTIQTALTARFNTERSVDKTNEDLEQVAIFVGNILQRFADNKVFGDWGENEEMFDGEGQDSGMREALLTQKYFVYIPKATDIEGFKVPIYCYFKIAGVVVKFVVNHNITRS